MVQCQRCGIELRPGHEGLYCYPCQAEVDWKVKTGEFKVCQRCGLIIEGKTGPNTKYCSECKEIVRKKRVKERVKKHRENNGLPENHKEQCREAMERYRKRWGPLFKQYRYDAIGKAYQEHGTLMNQYHTGKGTNNFGPHANPDFDKEMQLVKKEKKIS